MDLAAESQYLNDTIIDFYLKYLFNNVLTEEQQQQRTHIFSAHFYQCLNDRERQA